MNNSVHILRRLLTFRNCSRIVCSRYCDEGKVNKSGGQELASSSSVSAEPISQIDNNQGQKLEPQKTAIEDEPKLKDKKLSQDGEKLEGRTPIYNTEDVGEISKSEAGETGQSQVNVKDDMMKSDSTLNKKTEGGFLAAYQKQEKIISEQAEIVKKPGKSEETFTSLLRKSPFIDMGDPIGKIVIGEIFLVVNNDLYIDFGWKFHTVCSKPRKNPNDYVPGAKVFLKIKDLELSAKFLGEKEYITLLEADCEIVGLAKGREQNLQSQQESKG